MSMSLSRGALNNSPGNSGYPYRLCRGRIVKVAILPSMTDLAELKQVYYYE
jgi:hypothetical protein